ncbi:MAG: hypothetical protein MO852_16950, partial [Candidatus Devosia euplotis]|nr:hypothetical protein [Candidatus Devosia euplotis]
MRGAAGEPLKQQAYIQRPLANEGGHCQATQWQDSQQRHGQQDQNDGQQAPAARMTGAFDGKTRASPSGALHCGRVCQGRLLAENLA